LILKTTSNTVIKQYENQIEDAGLEIDKIEEVLSSEYDYHVPYRTSQEKVIEVLKSPYKVWQSYDVAQKQRFFSFIFEGNLYYSKKEGYRTPNYSLPIRIFEDTSTTQSIDVEMGGIEPPCIVN
jgi:site-specific DNA recombinase